MSFHAIMFYLCWLAGFIFLAPDAASPFFRVLGLLGAQFFLPPALFYSVHIRALLKHRGPVVILARNGLRLCYLGDEIPYAAIRAVKYHYEPNIGVLRLQMAPGTKVKFRYRGFPHPLQARDAMVIPAFGDPAKQFSEELKKRVATSGGLSGHEK